MVRLIVAGLVATVASAWGRLPYDPHRRLVDPVEDYRREDRDAP